MEASAAVTALLWQPLRPEHYLGFLITFTLAIIGVTYSVRADTNQVLVVDGEGSYVSVPSAPDLQNADAITVEAWIYPLAPPNGVNDFFIMKSDGQSATSQRSYELKWGNISGDVGITEGVEFDIFLGSSTWVPLARIFHSRMVS